MNRGVLFHLPSRIHFYFPLSFRFFGSVDGTANSWRDGFLCQSQWFDGLYQIYTVPISLIHFPFLCHVMSCPVWSFLFNEKTRMGENSVKLFFWMCVCFFFAIFFRWFPVKRCLHSAWRTVSRCVTNQNCFCFFFILPSLPTIKWYKFLYSLPSYRATLSKNRNNIQDCRILFVFHTL